MRLAVGIGASDIHIKSEKPAFLRLSGSLEAVEMDPLEPEHVKEFIEQSVTEQFIAGWHEHGQVDYSYRADGIGRFRVNGFL